VGEVFINMLSLYSKITHWKYNIRKKKDNGGVCVKDFDFDSSNVKYY
jgi:hypothetical protein